MVKINKGVASKEAKTEPKGEREKLSLKVLGESMKEGDTFDMEVDSVFFGRGTPMYGNDGEYVSLANDKGGTKGQGEILFVSDGVAAYEGLRATLEDPTVKGHKFKATFQCWEAPAGNYFTLKSVEVYPLKADGILMPTITVAKAVRQGTFSVGTPATPPKP